MRITRHWGMGIVVALGLVALPLVAGARQHGTGGSGAAPKIKTEDCAAHIRAKVPLPEKMAEIHAQLADNLEMHIKAQSAATDKASRMEVAFLKKLAKEHRAVSMAAKRMATLMASASFPPAPHDMSKMDERATAAMSKQAMLMKQMSELLTKDAGEIDRMLASMKGKGKGMAKAGK